MSKSNRGYTRRAFMVVGGTAVGAATLTGTAHAATTHKKLHEAITALEAARDYLKSAHHNFGGHKAEAIEHINKSVHHLKLCLDF